MVRLSSDASPSAFVLIFAFLYRGSDYALPIPLIYSRQAAVDPRFVGGWLVLIKTRHKHRIVA